MHATSGSLGVLEGVILDWLAQNEKHLSKSEFQMVVSRVKEAAEDQRLFRTKRASIDYAASYPHPGVPVGARVIVKASNGFPEAGISRGEEVCGSFIFWNPTNGRTTVEVEGSELSGLFQRAVTEPEAPEPSQMDSPESDDLAAA